MSKIEELISKRKGLNTELSVLQRFAKADTVGVGLGGTYIGEAGVQIRLRPRLQAFLQGFVDEVAGELNEVDDLIAKAEAALNPPPVIETIANTAEKWFAWDEVDPDLLDPREEYLVQACTIDSFEADDLSLYGPAYRYSGDYCVDKATLLQAGIDVTGAENALVVIKRLEK